MKFGSFLFFSQASSQMESLAALSDEYNTLRDIKGHWNGGEYNKAIDGPNGRKHQVLEALGKQLGVPGTPVERIFDIMKKPDEISPEQGAPLMPGPQLIFDDAKKVDTEGLLVLKYYWRNQHDYLWFAIDPNTNKLVKSDWYHALE